MGKGVRPTGETSRYLDLAATGKIKLGRRLAWGKAQRASRTPIESWPELFSLPARAPKTVRSITSENLGKAEAAAWL